MSSFEQFCCINMMRNIGEDIRTIHYNQVFDEYGIKVPEDAVSYMLIQYCPWCGSKLPASKRDEWFAQLEKLGFDSPLMREDIPEDFRSAAWRL